MITADKRDYRKAYNRHKVSSEKLDEKSSYSKNLLLFYSVECGLKYLLMNKWDILSINEIEQDEEKRRLLGTHNLKAILKVLGQQGLADFSSFRTNHGDIVDINTYHQAYRYGIECDKRDIGKVNNIQAELYNVDRWIEEELN